MQYISGFKDFLKFTYCHDALNSAFGLHFKIHIRLRQKPMRKIYSRLSNLSGCQESFPRFDKYNLFIIASDNSSRFSSNEDEFSTNLEKKAV